VRLYILYAILMGALVIAAVEATPGLPERIRRGLTIAVALLVIAPGVLFLLFGGG
jgi:hypothetical protein